MKIKFLLSDLDGVIRMYPYERVESIEKKHGLQPGIIFSTAFEKELLNQAVCGVITDELWRFEIARSLAKICGKKVADEAVREWSDFSGAIDHRYLDYIGSRFPGVPLAVLTNGTSRLKSDLTKLGILNRFFKVFNSAEIGVCKPDKKVFQHVLKGLGCEPSEILFVDDSLSHVQAAIELGILSHHYRSLEEFQNFLISVE